MCDDRKMESGFGEISRESEVRCLANGKGDV
jgi:hypothetical protein